MPLAMPKVVFESKLLKTAESQQAISNALTRIGKKFKKSTKDKMVAGPHTGRTYERRGPTGARRFHRASARFERPSPDTFNLVNSVEDQKTSQSSHEVFVDDSRAPYGKWLEGPRFERVIMSDSDVQEFVDGDMKEELDKLHEELTS